MLDTRRLRLRLIYALGGEAEDLEHELWREDNPPKPYVRGESVYVDMLMDMPTPSPMFPYPHFAEALVKWHES